MGEFHTTTSGHMVEKHYKNTKYKNISDAKLLLIPFLIIIVKDIIQIEIFLTQIYCLLLFDYYSIRDRRN